MDTDIPTGEKKREKQPGSGRKSRGFKPWTFWLRETDRHQIKKIAEETGQSESAVGRAVLSEALADAGLVARAAERARAEG